MATKFVNIKGCVEQYAPSSGFGPLNATPANTGAAFYVISFDMAGTVYTGGADTAQIGGGGSDGGIAGSATLVTTIQNRRRDGRTVTLLAVLAASITSGYQSLIVANGPFICVQSLAISGSNLTCNLFSLPTGGSALTTTAGAWERAVQIGILVQLGAISSD